MRHEEVVLGRQPVLDGSGALVAYELLFRKSDDDGPAANFERPLDEMRASSQVMAGALVDIGLSDSLGPHFGYVNTDHSLLMDDVVNVLPPDRFVLEVLETTTVDAALRDRLAELRALGYSLALDDVASLDDPRLALLPLVDIVKVDVLLAGAHGSARLAGELAGSGKTLLAEKVETAEQFEAARNDGFELFQGFFFAQPQLLRTRRPIASSDAILRLLTLLEQDCGLDVLADELRRHPDLATRLLRLVRSGAAGIRHTVDSIPAAIQLVGTRQISRWAQLLLYSCDNQRPARRDPLVQQVGTRARTMELVAADWRPDDERLGAQAFMTGMLSKVDALFGMPLAEALKDLPLAAPIRAALLERDGRLGALLQLCEARERLDEGAIRRSCRELGGIGLAAVARAEASAAAWTLSISGAGIDDA
ncbi:MAG: EAL domain-containing protein [Limnobacter sp.]|nr:EAL domain-containing protein [Limnobacter sp.]